MNVDVTRRIELVSAAAPPNEILGIAGVIRVQLLEQGKNRAILHGRRRGTPGSCTLCSEAAFGTMMFSQILLSM